MSGTPSPIVTDDRDIDIAVAEAIGYRWYNAHGKCNLVAPLYYEQVIQPSIPTLFREGKSGEVTVVIQDEYLWPALPMFSVRLERAFQAAEIIGLFEMNLHGRGLVLLRRLTDTPNDTVWLWHVMQIDKYGTLEDYLAESTPAMVICRAIVKFVADKGATATNG